ncbi:MAG: alpha/beta hydrolase [Polaromonas sp.]|nr:alpha/beta hydrolase [Polaromonas sp.]
MTTYQTVTAGQAHLEVLIDGSGPAVVLIPSSQRDSLHEIEFVEELAKAGFLVLRPQPRGMGRSIGPLEEITLFDLADDIAACIDACAGGRAVVLGHAFGHSVARVTDLRYPEKVRGVGLLAAAARQAPAHLFALLDQAADAEDAPSLRTQAMQLALFAPGNSTLAWAAGWYPHLRSAYRRAGATPARDIWWPVSNSPVLDLQGRLDPWRPESSRNELRDVLGDKVSVMVVDGVSHAMLPERPHDVARAISSWIDGLPQ